MDAAGPIHDDAASASLSTSIDMSTLSLRNPHSVLAALQTRPHDVTEVQVSRQHASEAWKDVADLAQSVGVLVRNPPQSAPRGKSDRDGGRLSGNQAFVRQKQPVSLEQLFPAEPARGIWLALDCLQDPHNVGAIFRAAAFFGVKGIVLTEDRSAPLSAVVYDVASGGMEVVPFSVQTNLRRSLETAKEHNLWVLGSSEHAQRDVAEVDRDRRWLLVVGNEEKGMRRLTAEHCDELCTIPCQGSVVTSLNVSVATGILLSHLIRR